MKLHEVSKFHLMFELKFLQLFAELCEEGLVLPVQLLLVLLHLLPAGLLQLCQGSLNKSLDYTDYLHFLNFPFFELNQI